MKGIFNLLLNLAKKNPYPVGSIYMSVNATDPSTLFGGTWERIKDTFLLSAGDTYANGSTGGEATHTLTVAEMPFHRHTMKHNQSGYSTTIPANSTYNVWSTGVAWTSTAISNRNFWNTDANGSDEPHNNMPPYLAVYVWKRTA